MGKHEKLSGRERAARYRAAQRAKGLRLKQIWVPDLRLPEVREEIRRQAALIAASPHEPEDQAFIDSLAEDEDSLPPWDPD